MLRILYPLLLLPAAFSSAFASPEAGLDQDGPSPRYTGPLIPRAYDQAGLPVTTNPTPTPSHGPIVFSIGTFTVTARPTGFKVGSAALTPGGHLTVGSETLWLKTGGGAIVLDESTVSFKTKPQTLTGSAEPSAIGDSTPSSVPNPPNTHTNLPFPPIGSDTSSIRPPPSNPATTQRPPRSTPTPSRPGAGNPPTHTPSIHSDSTTPSGSSTGTPATPSPSHSDGGGESPTPPPPSPEPSHSGSSTTKKPTTVSAPNIKPPPSGSDGSSPHNTSSRRPPPPDSADGDTTTPTPIPAGSSPSGPGQTTAPPTTTPKTSADDWTTVSGSDTTGLYGFIILTDYKSLTTPTIITTQYIESSKTTTGPIFVGTGGTVLQSWPPSKNDDDHDGGGGALIIPDPIRPNIPKPELKCPAILKWLCGPDHTSSSNGGTDVDPATKPNSNPKDDPNKDNDDDDDDDDHTSSDSSTSTSDTSTATTTDATTTNTSKSSSSGSSCTQTQTVTNCAAECTPTVVSSKTTTLCHTTSCSTVEACSTTGSISTTLISTSSQRCGSGSASACPTFSTPREWVYPEERVDTAEVDKLASSILSEDASIWEAFSSILAETGSSNTLATTTRRTSSGAASRTMSTPHSAPSTTTSTKSTGTKTGSGTSTTTEALKCFYQYSSTSDQGSCYCEGHSGNREVMSSSSGMTNFQPCAWTTLPPIYTDKNVGPITSTLSNGDVVSCKSAHWAKADPTRKYCIGSMSTISTATHSTTTTSTTTSEGVSPTGEGDPDGEIYIGLIRNGYQYSWNVYFPDKVGDVPNWCDDSEGVQYASKDTTKNWLPPDIRFENLKGDGKGSNVPCVYNGDKDNVGTLSCLSVGKVPCTEFKQSGNAPMCNNNPLYAGSAYGKVYCKWYGSDHSL